MKRAARETFEQGADEALEKDYGAWLKEVRDRLRRRDFYEVTLLDAIFQGWRGHTIDLVDAYGFATIWAMLRKGEITAVTIDVGVCPQQDDCRAENQAALVHALEHPVTLKGEPDEAAVFKVWVDQKQNGAECDGSIRWSAPIKMTRMDHGDGSWSCPPMQVPLEIGTTTVETTWCHLLTSHGVARWPYDSKYVTIFVTPVAIVRL